MTKSKEVSYASQPISKPCMKPSVRYTTQQGIWDCQILGDLTDADIRRYAKQGRYGIEWKEKMLARAKKKKTNGQSRKKQLQHILDLIVD